MRIARLLPVAVLLFPLLILAAASPRAPLTNYPFSTGCESVDAPVVYPPYLDPIVLDEEDLAGDTVTIGTTWWESQANGTIPQQIVRDSLGYIHVAWMNGLNSGASNRHVYYNAHNPAEPYNSWLWTNVGTQVDNFYRAGYPGCDTRFGGRAFPSCHIVQPG